MQNKNYAVHWTMTQYDWNLINHSQTHTERDKDNTIIDIKQFDRATKRLSHNKTISKT